MHVTVSRQNVQHLNEEVNKMLRKGSFEKSFLFFMGRIIDDDWSG